MALTIPSDLEQRLVALADSTSTDPQRLLEELLTAALRRARAGLAADIDAKIRAGMEQANRGECLPFDEVMDEMEAIIVAAERRHATK